MKKTDVLKEIKNGQYLITSPDVWEIRDETYQKEHGVARTVRVFKVLDADTLEELPLDKMTTEIVEALKDQIDVRVLLKEVLLQNTPVEDVLKIHAIITKHPKAAKEATPRHGCFFIDIPNPDPGAEGVALYLMR